MRIGRFFALTCSTLIASVSATMADETVRNYGATYVDPAVQGYSGYTTPGADVVAGQTTVVAGNSAAASVAFGHHRRCCGDAGAAAFQSNFNAYSTYQPNAYSNGYAPGNYGYGAGYQGYNGPPTPNPYGYYPNGAIWGSSGPTYQRPFPVWDSPSGVYDYRYRGWGSYGWGGWGGTGPAGWGYQGGFYW